MSAPAGSSVLHDGFSTRLLSASTAGTKATVTSPNTLPHLRHSRMYPLKAVPTSRGLTSTQAMCSTYSSSAYLSARQHHSSIATVVRPVCGTAVYASAVLGSVQASNGLHGPASAVPLLFRLQPQLLPLLQRHTGSASRTATAAFRGGNSKANSNADNGDTGSSTAGKGFGGKQAKPHSKGKKKSKEDQHGHDHEQHRASSSTDSNAKAAPPAGVEFPPGPAAVPAAERAVDANAAAAAALNELSKFAAAEAAAGDPVGGPPYKPVTASTASEASSEPSVPEPPSSPEAPSGPTSPGRPDSPHQPDQPDQPQPQLPEPPPGTSFYAEGRDRSDEPDRVAEAGPDVLPSYLRPHERKTSDTATAVGSDHSLDDAAMDHVTSASAAAAEVEAREAALAAAAAVDQATEELMQQVQAQVENFRDITGMDSAGYIRSLNEPHFPSLEVSESVRKGDASSSATSYRGNAAASSSGGGTNGAADASSSSSSSSSEGGFQRWQRVHGEPADDSGVSNAADADETSSAAAAAADSAAAAPASGGLTADEIASGVEAVDTDRYAVLEAAAGETQDAGSSSSSAAAGTPPAGGLTADEVASGSAAVHRCAALEAAAGETKDAGSSSSSGLGVQQQEEGQHSSDAVEASATAYDIDESLCMMADSSGAATAGPAGMPPASGGLTAAELTTGADEIDADRYAALEAAAGETKAAGSSSSTSGSGSDSSSTADVPATSYDIGESLRMMAASSGAASAGPAAPAPPAGGLTSSELAGGVEAVDSDRYAALEAAAGETADAASTGSGMPSAPSAAAVDDLSPGLTVLSNTDITAAEAVHSAAADLPAAVDNDSKQPPGLYPTDVGGSAAGSSAASAASGSDKARRQTNMEGAAAEAAAVDAAEEGAAVRDAGGSGTQQQQGQGVGDAPATAYDMGESLRMMADSSGAATAGPAGMPPASGGLTAEEISSGADKVDADRYAALEAAAGETKAAGSSSSISTADVPVASYDMDESLRMMAESSSAASAGPAGPTPAAGGLTSSELAGSMEAVDTDRYAALEAAAGETADAGSTGSASSSSKPFAFRSRSFAVPDLEGNTAVDIAADLARSGSGKALRSGEFLSPTTAESADAADASEDAVAGADKKAAGSNLLHYTQGELYPSEGTELEQQETADSATSAIRDAGASAAKAVADISKHAADVIAPAAVDAAMNVLCVGEAASDAAVDHAADMAATESATVPSPGELYPATTTAAAAFEQTAQPKGQQRAGSNLLGYTHGELYPAEQIEEQQQATADAAVNAVRDASVSAAKAVTDVIAPATVAAAMGALCVSDAAGDAAVDHAADMAAASPETVPSPGELYPATTTAAAAFDQARQSEDQHAPGSSMLGYTQGELYPAEEIEGQQQATAEAAASAVKDASTTAAKAVADMTKKAADVIGPATVAAAKKVLGASSAAGDTAANNAAGLSATTPGVAPGQGELYPATTAAAAVEQANPTEGQHDTNSNLLGYTQGELYPAEQIKEQQQATTDAAASSGVSASAAKAAGDVGRKAVDVVRPASPAGTGNRPSRASSPTADLDKTAPTTSWAATLQLWNSSVDADAPADADPSAGRTANANKGLAAAGDAVLQTAGKAVEQLGSATSALGAAGSAAAESLAQGRAVVADAATKSSAAAAQQLGSASQVASKGLMSGTAALLHHVGAGGAATVHVAWRGVQQTGKAVHVAAENVAVGGAVLFRFLTDLLAGIYKLLQVSLAFALRNTFRAAAAIIGLLGATTNTLILSPAHKAAGMFSHTAQKNLPAAADCAASAAETAASQAADAAGSTAGAVAGAVSAVGSSAAALPQQLQLVGSSKPAKAAEEDCDAAATAVPSAALQSQSVPPGKPLYMSFSGKTLQAGFSAAKHAPSEPINPATTSVVEEALGPVPGTEAAANIPYPTPKQKQLQVQQEMQQQKSGTDLSTLIGRVMPATPPVGVESAGPLAGIQAIAATAANSIGLMHVQAVDAAAAGVDAIMTDGAEGTAASQPAGLTAEPPKPEDAQQAADSSAAPSHQHKQKQQGVMGGILGDLKQLMAHPSSSNGNTMSWDAPDAYSLQDSSTVQPSRQYSTDNTAESATPSAPAADTSLQYVAASSTTAADLQARTAAVSAAVAAPDGAAAGVPLSSDAAELIGHLHDLLHRRMQLKHLISSQQQELQELRERVSQTALQYTNAADQHYSSSSGATEVAMSEQKHAMLSAYAEASEAGGSSSRSSGPTFAGFHPDHTDAATAGKAGAMYSSNSSIRNSGAGTADSAAAKAADTGSATQSAQHDTPQSAQGSQLPAAHLVEDAATANESGPSTEVDAAAASRLRQLEQEYRSALQQMEDLETEMSDIQGQLSSLLEASAPPVAAKKARSGPGYDAYGVNAAIGYSKSNGGSSNGGGTGPIGIGGGPGAAAAAAANKQRSAAAGGTPPGVPRRQQQQVSRLTQQQQQQLLALAGYGGGGSGGAGSGGGGSGNGGFRGPSGPGPEGHDDQSGRNHRRLKWPWEMNPSELMQLAVQLWLGVVVVSGVLWYAYQFLYKLPVHEVKQMASTAVHAAETGASVAHGVAHAASTVAHKVGNATGVETSLPTPEALLSQATGSDNSKPKGLGMGLIRKGSKKAVVASKAAAKGLKEAAMLLLPSRAAEASDSDKKAALQTAARLGFGLLLLSLASQAGSSSGNKGRSGSSRPYRSASFGYGMRNRRSVRARAQNTNQSSTGSGLISAATGLVKRVAGGIVAVPAAVLGLNRSKTDTQSVSGFSTQGGFGAGNRKLAPAGVMGYEDATLYSSRDGPVWGSNPGLVPGHVVLASQPDEAPKHVAPAPYGEVGSGLSGAGVLPAGNVGVMKRGESKDLYLQQYKDLLVRQGSWR